MDLERAVPPEPAPVRPSGTAPSLHPDHLADLRKSGLTDATILTMGVSSVRPGDLNRLAGWDVASKGATSALRIPYPDCDGFYQLKLFPAVQNGDGHAIRYIQPKNTAPRAYLFPEVRKRLADPAESALIVEGVKKAARLAQDGMNAVGMAAVWNWKRGGETVPFTNPDSLIPDLAALVTPGRRFTLCCDSDIWRPDRVDCRLAVYALGRHLEHAGASVRVMQLPQNGSQKVGADDYLLAHSLEDFRALMENAVPITHPALADAARVWDKKAAESPAIVLPTLDRPVAVLRNSKAQGFPIPTGIKPLDERLRGGMRPGKILLIGGAPHAGKSILSIQILKHMTEAECVAAALLPDEGREAGIIRLGQQYGYDRTELEQNNDGVLNAFEKDVEKFGLYFPDPDAETGTMPGATEALVQAHPDAVKVLLVDSIQTVRSPMLGREQGALRERIMASTREARRLAQDHNLVVILTSEVNRGFYRAKKEEDRISDLAAFAEARIEYAGDVGLVLWASQDDPDLVEVRIPKNRLGTRQGFLLRLDRIRARFDEVAGDPRQELRDMKTAERIDEAREKILRELTEHPGLIVKQLQELVHVKREVFFAALEALKKDGLLRTEPQGRAVKHYLREVPPCGGN